MQHIFNDVIFTDNNDIDVKNFCDLSTYSNIFFFCYLERSSVTEKTMTGASGKIVKKEETGLKTNNGMPMTHR